MQQFGKFWMAILCAERGFFAVLVRILTGNLDRLPGRHFPRIVSDDHADSLTKAAPFEAVAIMDHQGDGKRLEIWCARLAEGV
jgi:hypothetical protein